MTYTYWASIGRNVGSSPARTGEWIGFRAELHGVIRALDGQIITTVDGESDWAGDPEETHLVLFSVDATRLPTLRGCLADLGQRYNQDAIGLVGGPGTSLVEATR